MKFVLDGKSKRNLSPDLKNINILESHLFLVYIKHKCKLDMDNFMTKLNSN